jgi:hypothetical protein
MNQTGILSQSAHRQKSAFDQPLVILREGHEAEVPAAARDRPAPTE